MTRLDRAIAWILVGICAVWFFPSTLAQDGERESNRRPVQAETIAAGHGTRPGQAQGPVPTEPKFDPCASPKAQKPHDPSDPKLVEWYNEFNAKFFKHRLPTDPQIVWALDTDICPEGCVGIAGIRKDGSVSIFLSTDLQFSEAFIQLTLLHEMAHVGTGDWEHGKKFKKEMIRLAKAGAFEGLW